MAVEAGHIQITEYRKETIPYLNWMFEDLFCRYGVSIPYYLLDFSFPDYPLNAEWPEEYTPEWLALYKPGIPPWPEMPWWDIPDWKLPEMRWPEFPWVEWPKLPDMPWPEFPDWPEWEIPEWERLEFYWPEWDWPEWDLPESEVIRRRRKRRKLITEVEKTKKKIPIGITPPKPPIDLTNWYDGITNGFIFNVDQGEFGYDLSKLNELLGLLFDEADLPRLTLPDLSDKSMEILNNEVTSMYEAVEVSADYTFNSQTKDGYLEKYALSENGGSWNAAWTNMKAATPDVYTSSAAIGTLLAGLYRDDPYWKAWTDRAYLSFDTSSLTGKTITAATIKFYITYITALDDYETTRTVNIYSLAWGTLDTADWDTGTLVGSYIETDLTLNAYYTVTLTDTSIINKTGETQFVFASKADVDGDTISDPQDLGSGGYRGGVSHIFSSGDAASNKPVLTVTATG